MTSPKKPAAKKRAVKKMKGSFDTGSDKAVLVYRLPLRSLRFMFDDGFTVDVLAERDDSDLRADLLAHLGKQSIVGCARLDRGDDG